MTNFVKTMAKLGEVFNTVKVLIFTRLSDALPNEGIFVELDIRKDM